MPIYYSNEFNLLFGPMGGVRYYLGNNFAFYLEAGRGEPGDNSGRIISKIMIMVARLCLFAVFFVLYLNTCASAGTYVNPIMENKESKYETVTLGAGCFWCVEAIFERLDGVKEVTSGYSGGRISNPTYREVTSGRTGHAEVIQVTYDP
jgi:hypothetical protein